MKNSGIRGIAIAFVAMITSILCCSCGPNLESPEVQETFLRLNEDALKAGCTQVSFDTLMNLCGRKLTVHRQGKVGKAVSVVFIDGCNNPPMVASAAIFIRNKDGSWFIAQFIAAAEIDGKMKTIINWANLGVLNSGDMGTPDGLAFNLDLALKIKGAKEREKLEGMSVRGSLLRTKRQ